MTDEPEVPLTGGDMTAVVRVGDTVRRTAGPWTPAVHALLRQLTLFCAEYGDIAPADVAEAAIAKERELVEWIVACAAAGDPAQQAVLERGDVAIYEHDIAHLETHRDALA
jgi:hypothetical protein